MHKESPFNVCFWDRCPCLYAIPDNGGRQIDTQILFCVFGISRSCVQRWQIGPCKCVEVMGERKLVITIFLCVQEYHRQYPNECEFTEYLKSLDEMENVVVIDLFTPANSVPGLDESCFFDHQHLNAKRAAMVTRVLKQRMLKAGVEL